MKIFISLPTTDLERAKTFYEALGWTVDPKFSDERGARIVIDDDVSVMIMLREFLQAFSDKPIADPSVTLQTQTGLTYDTKEEIDALVERAVAAGGTEPRPAEDLGFMYSRDFEDPDGNHFGAMWMDPAAQEQGPPTA